jgi:hypothetical protein
MYNAFLLCGTEVVDATLVEVCKHNAVNRNEWTAWYAKDESIEGRIT